MALQMVTANLLSDGGIVYLAGNGQWSHDFSDGIAVEEANSEQLLSDAEKSVEECTVVAPYLIAVEGDGDNLRPVRYREQIRAGGPTVKYIDAE